MDENPRRPARVIVLIVAFWIVGTTLQWAIGSFLETNGLVAPDNELPIRQVLAWGLLFGLSYYYRDPIDLWLRR